jgi:hypothetical protein
MCTSWLLCYVAGAYHFAKWCRGGRRSDYWLALCAVSLAGLAKLPAVHIGILLACLSVHAFGLSAFRRPDLWLFAAVAVLCPVLWYWHAHLLWVAWGNSLGMSNEAFLRITSGSFLHAFPDMAVGNLRTEVFRVYTAAGVVLAGIGLRRTAAARSTWPLLYWLLALAIYYFVTGRTTGEEWATHYHIVSLAPAALLIAAGFSGAARRERATWWPVVAVALIGLGAGAAALAAAFRGALDPHGWPALAALWSVLAGGLMLAPGVVPVRGSGQDEGSSRCRNLTGDAAAAALVLCLALTLLLESRALSQVLHPASASELYACAQEFERQIVPGSLIVASAPGNVDQYGLTRAYNASYMFFWTRTKGFSIPDNAETLLTLEGFRRRGARYYIAERSSLETSPAFAAELRRRYRTVSECRAALLVQLVP